jgi:hypothetical protein
MRFGPEERRKLHNLANPAVGPRSIAYRSLVRPVGRQCVVSTVPHDMTKRSSHLTRYLRRLFWVAAFSLVIGAGLQIAAAIRSGVFEKQAMYDTMESRNMKGAVEA